MCQKHDFVNASMHGITASDFPPFFHVPMCQTYAPMSDYAVRVSKQHCERMVALARQRRCSVTAHGFVPIHGFILLRWQLA